MVRGQARRAIRTRLCSSPCPTLRRTSAALATCANRQGGPMPLSDRERLAKLGAGESIASLCTAEKISRSEFDGWWQRATAERVPTATGTSQVAVRAGVQIHR